MARRTGAASVIDLMARDMNASYWLSPEERFEVPGEQIRIRMLDSTLRQADRLPIERIIGPTVLKIRPQFLADMESVVRAHGHVPHVEESMNIAAQQEAIRDLMGTVL